MFSDIKTAVSKIHINQGTHITVESLHTYHSSFCKSLVPFSEEIALQNTSADLHVTLIQAFYNGIPHSFANKLRETLCSTWKAAQTEFPGMQHKSKHAVSSGQRQQDHGLPSLLPQEHWPD